MSRARFDQLAKQYLEDFLEPLGTVQRNLEVSGEAKFVDLWFTPNPSQKRPIDLGLLSRIASTPCLLEPFRNAPNRQEVRSCLLKLLWLQEDHRRRTRREGDMQTEDDLPRLWILAATTSQPVVVEFGGVVQPDWGNGIYHFPAAYRGTIVAIDQLPPTQDTLWLRLLGRDQVQQQAIRELLTLPRSNAHRDRVLELLASWKVTLELGELKLRADEERLLMVQLSQAYLEWKQATIQEGRLEGRLEGELKTVLRLLNRRFGSLSDDCRAQIQSLSLHQIEDLADRLLDFTSDADLTNWLQQLTDRRTAVNQSLQQRWESLSPDLQRQVQQLATPQLGALAAALPQFASLEDLAAWLQTQLSVDL